MSKALKRARKAIPLRRHVDVAPNVGAHIVAETLRLAQPSLMLTSMYGDSGPPPTVRSLKKTPGKSKALRRARRAQAISALAEWTAHRNAKGQQANRTPLIRFRGKEPWSNLINADTGEPITGDGPVRMIDEDLAAYWGKWVGQWVEPPEGQKGHVET